MVLIELFPGVFQVPGEADSKFPFCTGLFLKGRNLSLLIDAGMGQQAMEAVQQKGLDALILSHCHLDHRLNRSVVSEVPVWAHELEGPYLADNTVFFQGTGMHHSGVDPKEIFELPPNFETRVSRTLQDGDRIDLGGLTLEILHTPGHTPGHLAFFIPEARLLFSADVDLTPFGPFYGHEFSNLEDFIDSIDRLSGLDAETVLSGHAGPFSDDLDLRFTRYRQVIRKRDQALLRTLDRPMELEDFRGRQIVYQRYSRTIRLWEWFELVHVAKHLERLEDQGLVRREGPFWSRST